MGRPGPGPRRRRVRVLPDEPVVVRRGLDRVGPVPVAELDRILGDDRLQVLLTEAGIEPEHVARVGLLDGELARRPALGVVGAEQRRARGAVQHVLELPRQVERVLDARVPAEPSGRRHHVRRVARDQDAALGEALRPVGGRRPALDVLDLYGQVGRSERQADVIDARLLAHVLADRRRAVALLVDRRVDDEEAGVAVDREAEEADEPGMEDVDDAEVPVAEQFADVGAEVDRDAVREAPVAQHLDPEAPPDRAVRAVGGDQVLRPHGPLVAAVTRPDAGRHPVAVLRDVDDLRCVLHLGAARACLVEQDRLQADLGDEHPGRGAEVFDALVDLPEVPVELLAAQALDRHDRPVLDELAGGRLLDRRLDPDRAIGLHRALVDERRARVDRGPDVALDHQGRNAPLRRGRPPPRARRGSRPRSGPERRCSRSEEYDAGPSRTT